MKRTLLTTLLTLFAAAAFAQRGGVTATVVDADTGESVVGAVLTLTPVKTPEKKQYFTSAFKGAVSIPSLAYGEYSLSGAFLGYNNLDTTFRVSASKVSLGLLKLKPGVQIETVVKEAKALRTSQKGDTVSYNAGAFKVTADADVEGLLKKMPGITGENLLAILEQRLDNVVFRLGFAMTRREARQLVNHGHVTVNGRKVNIPSFQVKPGMVISLTEKGKSMQKVKENIEDNAFRPAPKWIEYDKNNMTAKIVAVPARDDIDMPIEEHLIVELYSK